VTKKIVVEVPLNRVEGDLEIRAEVEDGVVTDAWCSGIMYRGIEKILVGRGALDGLVITPRVCGICGTSHLTAAVRALESVAGVTPPSDAIRMRSIAQMAEHVQSDIRHAFLMFAGDFTNPVYADQELFPEAVRRYAPFQGESVIEVIRHTKRIVEIVAIIGGQWPHSSYMVPGGIASMPSASDLLQCSIILSRFRTFYEQRILGCTLERFSEVTSVAELDAWLSENSAHRDSDLGFFIRYCKAIGLQSIGHGPDRYLSFGGIESAGRDETGCPDKSALVAAGFARGSVVDAFDQSRISEHVSHSWFEDYGGGLHPSEGVTQPYASGREGKAYSWAKAPRYDESSAETGPLAELIMARHPLVNDLVDTQGASALVRQFARVIRPATLLPTLQRWIDGMDGNASLYVPVPEIPDGEGFGLVEATRGALGHWIKIVDGVIAHYQIITPTAWNASPRDGDGHRGPIEQALIGTPIRDAANPVELGHVVRSFDTCLVCTVHSVTRSSGRRVGSLRVP